MNKMDYQNAMRQISAEKEEILMKAKQMQAQYDAQNTNKVARHSSRRGMLAGLAAAAAVLICGTVTVGAVNDWNYAAVFSRYFSEKSGGQVLYDFTGMGMDVGETVTGDGYTLTIQSIMADATAVYVAYDVELSDEINATIEPYGDAEMSLRLEDAVFNLDEDGVMQIYNTGGASPSPVRDADGIWHGVLVTEIEDGADLSDKQIRLKPLYPSNVDGQMDPLYIAYNFPPPETYEPGESMNLASEDFELCYDLSGITVQEGVTVSYGGTLPNDANENIFDEMTVTPFKLRFTLEEEGSAYDSIPSWGRVWGDDVIPVTYTAVYADGTELTREATIGSGSHMGGGTSYQPDGSWGTILRRTVYFTSPIPMDGLTAIRINDIEVPVQ